MEIKHYQKLELWCLSNNSLCGKIIKHPSLGQLQIKGVSENGVRVAGYDFLISKHLFLDNFMSLFSSGDISDLRIEWIEYERLMEEKEIEIKRINIQEKIKEDQITAERIEKENEEKLIFKKKEKELDFERESFSEEANKYDINKKEFVDDYGPTKLVDILPKITNKEQLNEDEIEWLKEKTKWQKDGDEHNDLIRSYSNLLGIYYYFLYKGEIRYNLPFSISSFLSLGNKEKNKESFDKNNIWNLVNACKYFRKASNPKRTLEISADFAKSTHAMNSDAEAAVFTSRGGALKDLRNITEAKEIAFKVINFFPESFYPYNLLGAISFLENDCKKGEEYFDKAIKLGSSPEIQRFEIRTVLKESEQDDRNSIIGNLFKINSIKYAWVKKYK